MDPKPHAGRSRAAVAGTTVAVTALAVGAGLAPLVGGDRTAAGSRPRATAAPTVSAVPAAAAWPGVAPGPGTPSATRPATGEPDGPPDRAVYAPSLNAAYHACAVAAGFDPGGVQVIVGASGPPYWVKTGRDVPAEIHRPCFVRIGGADPHRSSHGYPGP